VGTVTAETVNDRVKLLVHRLIARHLKSNPDMVVQARGRLTPEGDGVPGYVGEWMSLLESDVDTVRRKITERSPDMNRLRLSSPLVDVLPLHDPDLRRRMYRKARIGLRSAKPT
jgi:hypothetical protein